MTPEQHYHTGEAALTEAEESLAGGNTTVTMVAIELAKAHFLAAQVALGLAAEKHQHNVASLKRRMGPSA